MRNLWVPGLEDVQLVFSDQHTGLVATVKQCFERETHPRLRIHFAGNLVPRPEGVTRPRCLPPST